MVVTETIAGLNAIKAAFDMSKALQGIHDAVAHDRAVIDLQREILAAQAAQSELVQVVGNLEKEVARLKSWEADRSRYQLAELRSGIVALALKQDMANGEPFHRICADCAANGKKFYLQKHVSGPNFDQYKCGGCGASLGIDKGRSQDRPSHDYEDEWLSVRR